jgi:hypothetical protein
MKLEIIDDSDVGYKIGDVTKEMTWIIEEILDVTDSFINKITIFAR